MFGKNPIRSINISPIALALEDVFYTLQGEGPYSGMPSLFIRLAGCNLACHFCDTQFETQAENEQTIKVLIDRIFNFTAAQRKFVVLTGGEPLRQNPVRLLQALYDSGTELVQVETAGTLWQPDLEPFLNDGRLVLVCSPKTPKIHPLIATHCKHYKYIIRVGETDHADGLPDRGTQVGNKEKHSRLYRAWPAKGDVIWVSPCDEYDVERNKQNVAVAKNLALKYGYRLSLQMHKIVGVA